MISNSIGHHETNHPNRHEPAGEAAPPPAPRDRRHQAGRSEPVKKA
jgi:hypothetical protein